MIRALNMFHLPYYKKLYHKDHILFNYVMMTGYNDETENIMILDCGREELEELPFNELQEALKKRADIFYIH